MAKATTITFGITKGGVGKTTSSAIVAYLLSKDYKVLAIDMDSQGNLTSILTQRNIYDFDQHTVLEAMKEGDALKYVHSITENLHILTSNDLLALLPHFLYNEYRGKQYVLCLDEALREAKEVYDYIIIDSPPAIGEQTLNALCTSDSVVLMFETSKFAYDAIDRYMEFIETAKQANEKLQVAGILVNILDSRRSENKDFLDALDTNYPGMKFKSMIKRQASTARLQLTGFTLDTSLPRIEAFKARRELNHAIDPYKPFLKELLQRVENYKQ